MKKGILAIYISLISVSGFSQQIPEYTQWHLHQFALNPAHAGIKQCVDIHSLYRMQWVSFDGAPRGGFLSVSIPLQARRRKFLSARHGTGFKFETDRIGQFNINRVNVAYAAHFNFNQNDRLSLGVYGGVVQTGYDPGSATTIVPDPEVMQQANFLSGDASFGAWFNSLNYYFGLTMQNLIPGKWEDIGTDSRYRFHMTLNGGYRWAMNDQITLLPLFKWRIPPRAPMSVDLNLYADYNNMLGFGIGYRVGDAMNAIVTYKIKEQFSISYSFDYTLTKVQMVAKNTHELSLRFTSCKPDKTTTSGCALFE